jgi:hypothetical protein
VHSIHAFRFLQHHLQPGSISYSPSLTAAKVAAAASFLTRTARL